jgi:hypothetical protein
LGWQLPITILAVLIISLIPGSRVLTHFSSSREVRSPTLLEGYTSEMLTELSCLFPPGSVQGSREMSLIHPLGVAG